MNNLDFSTDDDLLAFGSSDFASSRPATYPHYSLQPITRVNVPRAIAHLNEEMRASYREEHGIEHPTYSADSTSQNNAPDTAALNHSAGLGLAFAQNMSNAANLLQPSWQFSYNHAPHHRPYSSDATPHNSYDGPFTAPLQSSPVEYMPVTSNESHLPLQVSAAGIPSNQYHPMGGAMESMNALTYQLNDYQHDMAALPMEMSMDMNLPTASMPIHNGNANRPGSSSVQINSLSSSDNSWAVVNFHQPRPSLETYHNHSAHAVFNPGETLHIRTESDSSCDEPRPERLSGSYEDMGVFPMYSPSPDFNVQEFQNAQVHNIHDQCAVQTPPEDYSSPASSGMGMPVTMRPGTASSSTSPPGHESPAARRKKSSPESLSLTRINKVLTKKDNSGVRKANISDKKVGRRKGPLKPEQRLQAHEIRKLRACLRCKFLKKTCDKGDPCAGCRPSHARLWQVPCTRIDIKDIGFFIKDFNSDYERHVTMGFSVTNIKGFSTMEKTLYITHGYGHFLPVNAREVYVIDEDCFGVDWVESQSMHEYELPTAKLSAGMEGVSTTLLSEYVDHHLEDGFDKFVDDYFEGTPFVTEILHTAYKYSCRTKSSVVRKALKLVVAYTLTMSITTVEGLSEEEAEIGRVADETSRYAGKVMAPVMINFQVKCALAAMWRELQKDILEELSSLISSVYQGDKLRNWPTIFMVASILLGVWEMMQFDSRYREPDEKKVEKFCNDMESTPVAVIVGLFQAISQKLPTFMEWDSSKHSKVLNDNMPICDALTEVREHVQKHETHLRSQVDAKFDRNNFDCLSGKFLSRLVIRSH